MLALSEAARDNSQNKDNSATEIAAPRNALFKPDTDIG